MKTILICLFLFFSLGTYCQVDVKKQLPLTYATIARKAADQWPDNYEMQKYTIDSQCKAYNDFKDLTDKPPVPEDIYKKIMFKAIDDWSDNDLVKCSDENKDAGYDAITACLGANWEMVVYTMKKQFDAYNSLK